MDVLTFMGSLGGVARISVLQRHGFGAGAIQELRAAGAVQQRKGVWALPGADPEFQFAITHNGLLTCSSSASRFGLWLKDRPSKLHLATNHGRGKGFIRHGRLRFPPDSLLPIAALEDTVIHALSCLPEGDAIAVAESAMRHMGVPRAVIESELAAKYYGTARARLRRADGLSESLPEISAHLLFESAGLDFRRQVQVRGVGRVDFLVDGWLIIEINGFEFHGSRAAWRKDMGRSNAAQAQGYAVLSYAPEQIWNNSTMVLEEIRAVLERGRPGR